MSKPRDNWRPYVINVLRDYPAYRKISAEAKSQSVTTKYNKGRGGSGPSRTTELSALRTGLSRQQEKELEAVEKAIRKTRRMPDGKIRMKVVDLVYFRGTHTIDGAAMQVHVSYSTGIRWTDTFIRIVADNLGLE